MKEEIATDRDDIIQSGIRSFHQKLRQSGVSGLSFFSLTELPTGFFFYITWYNESLCWEWVYLLSGFKDLMFLLLGTFAAISFLLQSWGASHPHIGGLGGHCETKVFGSEMGGRGYPAFRVSFSVRSSNTKQFTNIKHMHRGSCSPPHCGPGYPQPSCGGSSCCHPGVTMDLLWGSNLT